MRVVYSDEMGVGQTDRFTVVAAIMLNLDAQWKPVERDLESIIAEMPRDYLVSGTELKGARLLKKFRKGRAGAADFLKRILAVPVTNHIPIFCGVVDRDGLRRVVARQGVGSADVRAATFSAFDYCMARVNDYVGTVLPGEAVLWIADRAGASEATFKESAKFLQQYLRVHGELGVKVAFDESPVVDTVYFGGSHESRALQLADVCGTVICEHLHGKSDVREFYDIVKQRIVGNGEPAMYSDEPCLLPAPESN